MGMIVMYKILYGVDGSPIDDFLNTVTRSNGYIKFQGH